MGESHNLSERSPKQKNKLHAPIYTRSDVVGSQRVVTSGDRGWCGSIVSLKGANGVSGSWPQSVLRLIADHMVVFSC